MTLTSVVVSGNPGSATAGQQFVLKAMANYSDTTTQDVTTQATWQSSNPAAAQVAAGGAVQAVAAGSTDIKATFNNVTGSIHVDVAAVPVVLPTIAGRVTDASSNQPIVGVEVAVLDGPNAGRLTVTDGAGAYALTNLAMGSFTVRFQKTGYITATRGLTLTADTRIELALTSSINVSGFYGTFNINISITSQSCGDFPVTMDPTGTLVLAGRPDGSGFTATITERGVSRTYSGGGMDTSGRFGGSFSGLVPGYASLTDRITPRHDASGSIDGRVTGGSVGGTENLTYGAPCPNGTLRVSFNGGK